MPGTMSIRQKLWRVTKSRLGLRRLYATRYAPFVHGAALDSLNRIRFGPDAPRFAETLWIDPREVEWFDRKGSVWRSARVVTGAWPVGKERPIETDPILRTSIARWVEGKSWEESGEIERMEATIRRMPGTAGCFSRADVERRCAELDGIFRVIERERRVRSTRELDPRAFRELGGIGMHIGPDGRLIRAGHGRHRFAMARILDLPLIPVRVGMVHHSALPVVKELRRSTDSGSTQPRRRANAGEAALAGRAAAPPASSTHNAAPYVRHHEPNFGPVM